ncbi:unnamed protein product [marine sediment metagenome]|uniref:Uncharacterized protein n=1 Tax=marine sediment metagenome TaxID=412755 RepID=X0UXH9_9ZZZZ
MDIDMSKIHRCPYCGGNIYMVDGVKETLFCISMHGCYGTYSFDEVEFMIKYGTDAFDVVRKL